MGLGGSTNAAIHLIAMARRAGIPLTLDDLAEAARRIPVSANLSIFSASNTLDVCRFFKVQ